ncbi:MAG: aspartate aminotransferase family protein, partial [Actinomycetota bacterium]|nr:aspartate aminotransferase family protein [Actinomycetota bacterium]
MAFDLAQLIQAREGENFRLHARYLSPQLPRVLETLGFDRFYTRGEGCYLWDRDDNRYLDLLSGFGTFALGRSHPTIMAALHEAIDADLPNLVQLDCALLPGLLAQALTARAHDGIERVFFTNSGAEAIESAIKFARCATKRDRILYCDHAFHGLTTGAVALNGGAEFRAGFGPLLPGCQMVPFGDLNALQTLLRPRDVAALIIEPIQGKGVNEAPDEFWPAAQELCRRHGTLLVIDEIQTGLGRTGRFFAHEHWDLRPDIITVSKALSGGFIPVGAMMCSATVSDSVYSSMDRAVVHSSTFSTNQLAMVAGLATLHAFDEEDIVDRARRTGETFMKSLAPLVDKHEYLHAVRGKGLMIGLVFGEPTSMASRLRWRAIEGMRNALFSQLIVVPLFHRHRILTQVAADNMNVVKLLPPLIAGEAEVDYFVDALDDVLTSAQRGPGLMFE